MSRLDWTNGLAAPDIEAGRDGWPGPGTGGLLTPAQPGHVRPPEGARPGAGPFVRLVYPPRIEKLPVSQDFNVQDWNITLPAVVGATATSPALVFQVPESQVGWLQELSVYCQGMTATTLFRATVRINEGPVPGFDDLQNSPGVANLYRDDKSDLRVRLPMRCRVDMVFTNLAAVAATIGGRLAGWYHPQADEIRVFGEDGVY